MSVNRFVVRTFRYHSEFRAMVFDASSTTPALLALLYSTFRLSSKSLNTQKDAMLTLSLWMQFWITKFDKEFEEDFFSSGLDCALDNLDAFHSFLQLRNHSSDKTLRHRLRALKSFLLFLNDRYTTSRYLDMPPTDIRTLSRRYHQKISSLINDLSGTSTRRKPRTLRQVQFDAVNSLTNTEVQILLKIVRPDTQHNSNPFNPWKSQQIQLRNYLMVKLMLDYGLRRGELLLLTTRSFVPNLSGNGYSLIVTDAEEDERLNPPSIKTQESHRTLYLAKEDYELLSFYVMSFVANTGESFLFLSSKSSSPLSLNQINCLFKDISNRTCLINPEMPLNITPHSLRHTWATDKLRYLIDVERCDMELAKDRLRAIAGWSLNSVMPNLYAKRFIADSANRCNIRRIKGKSIHE